MTTPIYDRYFHRRTPEQWAQLPDSVWYACLAEIEQAQAHQEKWRGLLPPPEALSPLLPSPLGVTHPVPREKEIPREKWCTVRHHAASRAAGLTRRFLQWFRENKTSPREVGRRHGLRASTLADHLVGNSVMQDGVAQDWKAACDGLVLRDHPDPLLYYWRNQVYRWPELPLTVAGQQANLMYPLNLEMRLVERLYAYDEPCYCRFATWDTTIRTLQRTGEPEIRRVLIGRSRASGGSRPLEALDVFHQDYLRENTRAAVMARLAADPGAVVAEYMAWDKPFYGLPPGFGRTSEKPPQWASSL